MTKVQSTRLISKIKSMKYIFVAFLLVIEEHIDITRYEALV